jgi:hypothetical protein
MREIILINSTPYHSPLLPGEGRRPRGRQSGVWASRQFSLHTRPANQQINHGRVEGKSQPAPPVQADPIDYVSATLDFLF